MGESVSQNLKESFEVVKDVGPSEMICEQKKIVKVSKDFKQGQILDVPVAPLVEQSREVPKMVSQDSTQQRTAEQIVDWPVFMGQGSTALR